MSEPSERVRIGIQIGHQAAALTGLATRAEALGYDSVWMGDHLTFHTATLEALTALTWVAAATTRVRLGPCVYLLALRHPVVAAKAVATLDLLSGGRVVFGVGVGGEFPKEFEAAGVPHRERGRRVDEGIAVCRALWGPSPASYEGRHFRFAEVAMEPKPAQAGGPPIWIGGRSDHALRRAARLGDGWVSYLFTPERYRAALDRIQALAGDAGRRLDAGRGFEAAHLAFAVIDDDRERARAAAARQLTRQYAQPFDDLVAKYCVLGPAAQCIETLERYVAAGARTLILYPVAGPERAREQLERFGAEVLPHFQRGAR